MNATLKTTFWSNEKLEDSPPEMKLACIWLITNPSRDICGFSRVSAKRFVFETGLEPKWLDAACKTLPTSFATPCKGVWFAVNFLRHQFSKGGRISRANKVIVAAVRHAESLPCPMRDAFFKSYPELSEKGKTHPSPSHPPSEILEGVIEREGEREGEGSREVVSPETDPLNLAAVEIVEAYPRRERFAEAVKEVRAQLRAAAHHENLAATMLAATHAAAAVIRKAPSGAGNKYCPSALNFFLHRRYMDDPAALFRNGSSADGRIAQRIEPTGRQPSRELDLSQP